VVYNSVLVIFRQCLQQDLQRAKRESRFLTAHQHKNRPFSANAQSNKLLNF